MTSSTASTPPTSRRSTPAGPSCAWVRSTIDPAGRRPGCHAREARGGARPAPGTDHCGDIGPTGTGPTDPATASPPSSARRSTAAAPPPRRNPGEPLLDDRGWNAARAPRAVGAGAAITSRSLVIGLADLPAEQRRTTVEVDLERRGGVLVMGARSGALGATHHRGGLGQRSEDPDDHAIDNGRSLDGIERTAGAEGPSTYRRSGRRRGHPPALRSLRRRCGTAGTAQRTPARGTSSCSSTGSAPSSSVTNGEPGRGGGPAHRARRRRTRLGRAPGGDRRKRRRGAAGDPGRPRPEGAAALRHPRRRGSARRRRPRRPGPRLAGPDLPAGRGLFDGRLVQVAAPPILLAGPDGDPDAPGRSPRRARRLAPSVDAETLPPASGWRSRSGSATTTSAWRSSTCAAAVPWCSPPRSGRSPRCHGRQPTRPDGLRLRAHRGRPPSRRCGRRPERTPRTDHRRGHRHRARRRRRRRSSPSTTCPAVGRARRRRHRRRAGPTAADRTGRALRARHRRGGRGVRCYADSFRRLRSTRTGLLLRPGPASSAAAHSLRCTTSSCRPRAGMVGSTPTAWSPCSWPAERSVLQPARPAGALLRHLRAVVRHRQGCEQAAARRGRPESDGGPWR